jgi:hypothetical protein
MPSSSRAALLSHVGRAALVLAWLAAGPCRAPAEAVSVARIAGREKIHALVVGIDAYRYLPRLKGAAADARDIAAALRARGASDVTLLLDDAADRAAILAAAASLQARLHPGDLVVLSVAGRGAEEPERVKGSAREGTSEVFLLAGFDTTASGSRQRFLDMEFKRLIKDFESAGVNVLFVADTSSGRGLARSIDARADAMTYRSTPPYHLEDDAVTPRASPTDAFLTELDFERTIVLAAADRNTKAPEIKVPGIPGYRGALSYAFARALEGAADTNKDGDIGASELVDYVRQVTYQLSDGRQSIVAASPPGLVREPVVRSVTVVGEPEKEPAPSVVPVAASPRGEPIRIAVLGGDAGKLAGLKPIEAQFEVVTRADKPDLVWDAESGDVIAEGDVVARGLAASDLPSVVDRTAAVRAVKQIAAKSVQTIRLAPDSSLHRGGSRIEIELEGLAGRSLLLFNIAGDGTVQLLYPTGNDPKVMIASALRLPIVVGAPFGSDQVVAVTASQRQAELEQALARASDRRTSAQVVSRLARVTDPDVRIGSVGVFTSP